MFQFSQAGVGIGRGQVASRAGFRAISQHADDVVEAAGVSHGAFYRYFENSDDLAQVVAVRALRAVSTVLGEAPAATVRQIALSVARR